ncbi:hypothetical protein BGW38_001057 [Lunasporangiospora selenospora]|uniref:Serine aminopeptidase S33 domain-containing protein n=1 Tax=Lunasporangiospora selenospora TaxID=979761 RepID=A0A9P6G1V3_9FUNG|nr:hypothetical protein BGW38_001057 [Lunasporangiospora selenospora]
MPFIQPTGIVVTRNNRSNSISNDSISGGSNAPSNDPGGIKNSRSAPNLRAAPKDTFEPDKVCRVKNEWIRSTAQLHGGSSNSDHGHLPTHVFSKAWKPIGLSVQCVVVFVHDIIEHCERYQSLFAYFASKGIEVQGFDLPGFGETGVRAEASGFTGGYGMLISEIDSAIGRATASYPSKPVFLMGHGMGGALVLNYVCGLGQRITDLAGVISSSPYLKPTLKGAGSRFPSAYNRLGKWYPNVTVGFQVSPEELTRDRAEQERYNSDGLIREAVSLRCLGDMIYQGNKLLMKRWRHFPAPLPTLLVHGTDDPISSYAATSILSTQLLKLNPANYIFKSWKGSRHDPHWDLDSLAIKSEYVSWIGSNSRHFVKLPLEPSMVRHDSLKSSRVNHSGKLSSLSSASSSISNSRRGSIASDSSQSTKSGSSPPKKQESTAESKKKDNNNNNERRLKPSSSIRSLSRTGSMVKEKIMSRRSSRAGKCSMSSASVNSPSGKSNDSTMGSPTSNSSSPSLPSVTKEPEAIQDLDGLRRQQMLKQQLAEQKRREYGISVVEEQLKQSPLAQSKSSKIGASPALSSKDKSDDDNDSLLSQEKKQGQESEAMKDQDSESKQEAAQASQSKEVRSELTSSSDELDSSQPCPVRKEQAESSEKNNFGNDPTKGPDSTDMSATEGRPTLKVNVPTTPAPLSARSQEIPVGESALLAEKAATSVDGQDQSSGQGSAKRNATLEDCPGQE